MSCKDVGHVMDSLLELCGQVAYLRVGNFMFKLDNMHQKLTL